MHYKRVAMWRCFWRRQESNQKAATLLLLLETIFQGRFYGRKGDCVFTRVCLFV